MVEEARRRIADEVTDKDQIDVEGGLVVSHHKVVVVDRSQRCSSSFRRLPLSRWHPGSCQILIFRPMLSTYNDSPIEACMQLEFSPSPLEYPL